MNSTMVAARAGITIRQLRHWCDRGYVRPVNGTGVGSGYSLEFDRAEAAVTATMGRLVAAGFAVDLAEQVARAGCQPVEIGPGITVEVAPLPSTEVAR
jgi:hypothetical protein